MVAQGVDTQRCSPVAKRMAEPQRCGATVRPWLAASAATLRVSVRPPAIAGSGWSTSTARASSISRKAKRVCSLSPAAMGMSVARRTSACPLRLSGETGSSSQARSWLLDLAGEALRLAHAPGPVGVHHDADGGAERLARLRHARGRVVHAGVLQPHAHLHRAVAALRVLEHLLADAPDRRPAAGGVGGHAVAIAAAHQPPQRHVERAAEYVPERDVHAGERRDRDAAAADRGEGPAFADGVVGAASRCRGAPRRR